MTRVTKFASVAATLALVGGLFYANLPLSRSDDAVIPTAAKGAKAKAEDAKAAKKGGKGRKAGPVCPPHPYPCGDELPDGLEGPFDLAEVLYVKVPVPADHDDPSKGTIELEGWIGLPDVPEGVRVPVALHSTPYLGDCWLYGPVANSGGCDLTPDHPDWWAEPSHINALRPWRVDPIALVRRGYAAAFFSVRGTGNSGGCFDFGGSDERKDQALLIDWLASPSRTWSNARVAMGGVSYPAGTAIEGAVQSPAALKSIVIAGIISDEYTWAHTPQGAASSTVSWFNPLYVVGLGVQPPAGGTPEHTVDHFPEKERLCPDFADHMAEGTIGAFTDDRNESYYAERRYIDEFDEVTASVLLAQGFDDTTNHAWQENLLWQTMTNAPKRMIEGQWGHIFPVPEVATLDGSWENSDWESLLFAWLDYWLWGIGADGTTDPPVDLRVGTVDYQDSEGEWRESTSWPPLEGRDEVLYLAGDKLATTSSLEDRSYRSTPFLLNELAGAESVAFPYNSWPAFCPDPVTGAAGAGLAYLTEPLESDVTIAGNPFAYLRLSSDLPGGIVGVYVVNVPREFDCSQGPEETEIHVMGLGAADLRFYEGNFVGRDFPVDQPTNVRVDLWNFAEVVEAGDRLAVVVSHGEIVPLGYGRAGQPYYPQITVHGDSHVVLPFVEGSLGGEAPSTDYPPRPFVPPASTCVSDPSSQACLEEDDDRQGFVTKATGGGYLETLDGGKINFGFNAKEKAGRTLKGNLQLTDQSGEVEIKIKELTSIVEVAAPCGSVPNATNSLQFEGDGEFNRSDASFRICVQDNGEPGNSKASDNTDLFYLECTAGCQYDTASRTLDDAIDGGNIQVHGAEHRDGGEQGSQGFVEEEGGASEFMRASEHFQGRGLLLGLGSVLLTASIFRRPNRKGGGGSHQTSGQR